MKKKILAKLKKVLAKLGKVRDAVGEEAGEAKFGG